MSQLDAIKLTNEVRERLVEYGISRGHTPDPALTRASQTIWSGDGAHGGVVGELWVEAARPSESSGKRLRHLVDDGLFDEGLASHLRQTGAFPDDISLYTHQLRSLEVCGRSQSDDRPGVVVTAGTGGGKTESFLLPILNAIYATPRRSTDGIRALILYPMNALVNDQVERLDDWLRDQNRVSFFHMTSETPEDAKAAVRDGVPMPGPHRMRTRQQARGRETRDGRKLKIDERGSVPDVLITNYSMLEYMLCRPQDAVFFGPALEAIVLDEAHLYAGTLAAEITLLLRRVALRCNRTPQQLTQIATSATLGGNSEDLIKFASQIFSKAVNKIVPIHGEPAALPLLDPLEPATPPDCDTISATTWLPHGTIELRSDQQAFRKDEAEAEQLGKDLKQLVAANIVNLALPASGTALARLLHASLAHSPILRRLAEYLCQGHTVSLSDLSQHLWNGKGEAAIQATTTLLRLGASARNEPAAQPLLPHRLHLQVRAPTDLATCLFPACEGPDDVHLHPLGSVQAQGPEQCRHCESPTYPLLRCDNCGQWAIAGRVDNTTGKLRPAAQRPLQILVPQALLDHVPENATQLTVNPSNGNIRGAGTAGCQLIAVGSCPRCGESEAEDDDDQYLFRFFQAGDSLTLSLGCRNDVI